MPAEPLSCSTPGCGNQLLPSRDELRIVHAVFPDDLKVVRYLLGPGPRLLYCPRCRKPTDYPANGMCLIVPARLAVSYIPPEWLNAQPSLIEDTRRELEQNAEGWRIRVVDDVEEFRGLISHEIGKLSLPLIQGWQAMLAGGAQAAQEWFDQHHDEITPSFWASLRLTRDGLVRITVFFVPDPSRIPEIQRELAKLRGIWLFVQGKQEEGVDYQQWLASIIDRQLEETLALWTAWVARRLLVERRMSELEERVAAAICGPALDEPGIRTLAQNVATMAKASTPLDAYSLFAVMAAICRAAETGNPLGLEWTHRYAQFELGFRGGQISEPGWRLPFPFAATTLSVRVLWNIYAALMNQRTDKGKPHPQVEVLLALVKDLGLEREIGELSGGTLQLDLSSLNDKQVQDLLGGMLHQLVDQGLDDSVGDLARNLVRSHPHLAGWLAAAAARLLVQAGRPSSAVRAACRVAEQLNHQSRAGDALAVLHATRDDLQERSAWPPDLHARIDYANESGNAQRTLGNRQEALKCYEEARDLLAAFPGHPHQRVNQRNIAIVLRELGRIHESLALLVPLLDSSEGVEKAMVYNSIGAAHLAVHDVEAAARALEAGLALMPIGPGLAGERFNILVSLQSAYLLANDKRLARTVDDLTETARELNDVWSIATAASARAQAAERTPGLAAAARRKAIDSAIPLLRPILGSPADERPLPSVYLPLVQALAQSLLDSGQAAEAARAIDQTLGESVYTDEPAAWKLLAQRAVCAQELSEDIGPYPYLLRAMNAAIESSGRTDPDADPFRLMSDRRTLQFLLGDIFVPAFARGAVNGALIRLVADFQASVVLSQRIGGAGGFAGFEVSEPDLARWLAGGEGGAEAVQLLQCIETDSGIQLLHSRAAGSSVETALLEWSAPAAKIRDLSERAAFELERAQPGSNANPLAAIRGWKTFAKALAAAVSAAILPGVMVCVVPGPLSGLPLHWIVAGTNPLFYIPSLAAGAWFHRRRAALFDGALWRPRVFNDFVVWRAGERESIAARFQSASAELEALCAGLGVRYGSVRGAAATRDELLRLLGSADVIRISCHGRAKPPLTFEFMLASNGSLPPSLPAYWAAGRATEFIFDWNALPAGLSCPPVVFSAACASGRTAVLPGGERVGLERALFRAGSLTYVAPEWSVPVDPIQTLTHSIIRRYLSGDSSLARIVWEEAAAAHAAGMPEWVARSIAIHGDLH